MVLDILNNPKFQFLGFWGFEAWMFARLDWADKDKRSVERSMNLLWRPFSKHFGN